MKKIISIIGFVFMLTLALGALILGGYVSMVLLLALAFMISPFSAPVKERFLDSSAKKAIGWVAGIVIFFVAFMAVPTDGTTQPADESADTSATVADATEEVADRSLPVETDEIDVRTDNSAIVEETEQTVPVVTSSEQTEKTNAAEEANPEAAVYSIDLSEATTDPAQSVEEVRSTEPDQEKTTSAEADNNSTDAAQTTTVAASEPVDSDSKQSASDTEEPKTSNDNLGDKVDNKKTTETYVLNTSTKKIHHSTCYSVSTIKEKNYATSTLTIEELLAQGYTKCKNCFKY